MYFSKRGQGLSTNAIVLIILAVVVLAVLILGFTIGWNKINPFLGGGGSNVDEIAQQCELACATGSQFDYCSNERTIEVDGEEPVPGTCAVFSDISTAEKKAKYEKYGVKTCPQITCPPSETTTP